MITFKIKQYSTPVGRAIYRTMRLVPGQTKMSAGRKAIKTKRFLNEQAKLAGKAPVSATLGTAIPFPGATMAATNTVGRLEAPVVARLAPRFSGRVDNLANRMI